MPAKIMTAKGARYMHTLKKLCIVTTFGLTSIYVVNAIPTPVAVADTHTHTTVPWFIEPQLITSANLQAYSDSQPTHAMVLPYGLSQWYTNDTDPTATWPDATDPTWTLPLKVQEQFACIRYHESRNHLYSVNKSTDAEGWYQIIPMIWNFAKANIPDLPAKPLEATADQQSQVAVWYYHRNNGLYPEWNGDNC